MHQITRVISYQIKNRLQFLCIPGVKNYDAVNRISFQYKHYRNIIKNSTIKKLG